MRSPSLDAKSSTVSHLYTTRLRLKSHQGWSKPVFVIYTSSGFLQSLKKENCHGMKTCPPATQVVSGYWSSIPTSTEHFNIFQYHHFFQNPGRCSHGAQCIVSIAILRESNTFKFTSFRFHDILCLFVLLL